MITYKKLIGEGITDSNGEASYNYVGVGAGKIDVVASLDDQSHISDSSIVSQPVGVWDTIKYDNGTTDTNIWTNSDSSTEYDRTTNDYSSLTSKQIYTPINPTGNVAIDFELYQTNGGNNWFWYCVQSGNFGGCSINQMGLAENTWNKIHMEFSNSLITITNDYNSTVITNNIEKTLTNGFQFRFNVNGYIEELRFKNFKAYYI